MIQREEAARLVEQQLEGRTPAYDEKICTIQYGRMELYELFDYLYGGPPVTDAEKINARGKGRR